MADAKSLSSRLARKPVLIAPGVYNPFTALVAQAGFTTPYEFDALNDVTGPPEMIALGQRHDAAATAKKSRVR